MTSAAARRAPRAAQTLRTRRSTRQRPRSSQSPREESRPATVTVATFADANPNATASDFTATIDWGDGTSTRGTVVAQSGGGFAVDGAHTYANGGQFNTGVTIDDVGGSTASATSTATVKTTVTAAEAIANYQANPNIAPQVVVDSAANVVANLDGLETLASANDIVSISLTDSGTPTLTITATQAANDGNAWLRL